MSLSLSLDIFLKYGLISLLYAQVLDFQCGFRPLDPSAYE